MAMVLAMPAASVPSAMASASGNAAAPGRPAAPAHGTPVPASSTSTAAATEECGPASTRDGCTPSKEVVLLLTRYAVDGKTVLQVLGNEVTVVYSGGVSEDSQHRLGAVFREAADLLDGAAARLSPAEARAVGQVRSVNITQTPDVCLGETGNESMTLSTSYADAVTPAWLGALFAHEGQHALNKGKYKGRDRWEDERKASEVQLAVGEKIGLSEREVAYLRRWANPSNRAVTQTHMQTCFTIKD